MCGWWPVALSEDRWEFPCRALIIDHGSMLGWGVCHPQLHESCRIQCVYFCHAGGVMEVEKEEWVTISPCTHTRAHTRLMHLSSWLSFLAKESRKYPTAASAAVQEGGKWRHPAERHEHRAQAGLRMLGLKQIESNYTGLRDARARTHESAYSLCIIG